ncbi:MAG: hypothetical protein R3Y11_03890 [Pseudomonadota bacterium]
MNKQDDWDNVSGLESALQDVEEVNARRKEQARQVQYLEDLREVITTPAGQRLFTNLLGVMGVHNSIWTEGPSLYRDCALKDLGDELLNDIAKVDEGVFVTISRAIRLRAHGE